MEFSPPNPAVAKTLLFVAVCNNMMEPHTNSELIHLLQNEAAPENIEIKEASAEELSEFIKLLPNSSTASLNLADTQLGNNESDFWSCLKQINSIKEISFTNVTLSVNSAKSLAESIGPSNNSVTSLSIEKCKLGPRGLKALSSGIPQTLEHLRLVEVNMDHYGAQALGSVLPSSLRSLDISHNKKLGPEGVWKLSTKLNTLTQLETLNISSSSIENDGAVELARHLPAFKSLKKLILGNNRIGLVGMENLSQGLSAKGEGHPQLQLLDLSQNNAENAGASSLGKILVDCPQLLHLSLKQNRIGDDGCAAIVQGLISTIESDNESDEDPIGYDGDETPESTKLERIDLSDNDIGDSGAGAWVEHLDSLPSLVQLKLEGNPISEARTRILDMLLKHRDSSLLSPKRTKSSRNGLAGMLKMPDHSDRASDDTDATESTFLSSKTASSTLDMELVAEAREQLMSPDSSEMIKIPMDFIRHLLSTSVRRDSSTTGTFGNLHCVTEETQTYWVRELQLSPVSSRMLALRESVLEELENIHEDSFVIPSAYCFTKTAVYFVLPSEDDCIPLHSILRDEALRKSFPWTGRFCAMQGIAQALQHLHDGDGNRKPMFHGNVHPRTIWVHPATGLARLCDAGLSRLLATDKDRFRAGDVVWGSRGYRCVRYERGACNYSAASDMFALGMVTAEILTGVLQGTALQNRMASDVYYDIVLTGGNLIADQSVGIITKDAMETLGKTIVSCSNPIPNKRPTAATVAKLLEPLINT